MVNQPFDQDHVATIQAISKGFYSFSLALGGLTLACTSALPDSCDHPKLMTLYSHVIYWSLIALGSSICGGIFCAAAAAEITNKKLSPEEVSKIMKSRAMWLYAIIGSSLATATLMSFMNVFSAVNVLPFNPPAALTFCEQPDKPDNSKHSPAALGWWRTPHV